MFLCVLEMYDLTEQNMFLILDLFLLNFTSRFLKATYERYSINYFTCHFSKNIIVSNMSVATINILWIFAYWNLNTTLRFQLKHSLCIIPTQGGNNKTWTIALVYITDYFLSSIMQFSYSSQTQECSFSQLQHIFVFVRKYRVLSFPSTCNCNARSCTIYRNVANLHSETHC